MFVGDDWYATKKWRDLDQEFRKFEIKHYNHASYKKALRELRENYEESQKELEEEKQKRIQTYERFFSQDKEALSNEITGTYGFEHVE